LAPPSSLGSAPTTSGWEQGKSEAAKDLAGGQRVHETSQFVKRRAPDDAKGSSRQNPTPCGAGCRAILRRNPRRLTSRQARETLRRNVDRMPSAQPPGPVPRARRACWMSLPPLAQARRLPRRRSRSKWAGRRSVRLESEGDVSTDGAAAAQITAPAACSGFAHCLQETQERRHDLRVDALPPSTKCRTARVHSGRSTEFQAVVQIFPQEPSAHSRSGSVRRRAGAETRRACRAPTGRFAVVEHDTGGPLRHSSSSRNSTP
jgi:hypothetical protein